MTQCAAQNAGVNASSGKMAETAYNGSVVVMKNKHEKPKEHSHPKLLLETSDNIQSAMIISVLSQNGIAADAQSRGIGGAMDAYLGYSLYGDSIYVNEEDWENAYDIVESMTSHDSGEK